MQPLCSQEDGLPGPRRVGFQEETLGAFRERKIMFSQEVEVEVESYAESEGSGNGG